MAIQLNLKLPTGVTATYHVIVSSTADYQQGTASAYVNSYLDQPTFSGKGDALTQQQVDIGALLLVPVNAASLQSAIETYLLTLPQFQGGTQVA